MRFEPRDEQRQLVTAQRQVPLAPDSQIIWPHDQAAVRTHFFAPILKCGENGGGLTQGEHGKEYLLSG